MSVRKLNADVARAPAEAESGKDITLTRDGKPFLRVTRDGVDLGGPAIYEERTGR